MSSVWHIRSIFLFRSASSARQEIQLFSHLDENVGTVCEEEPQELTC